MTTKRKIQLMARNGARIPKGRGVSLNVGHLMRAFCLFLNQRKMEAVKKQWNLERVNEFLTSEISPKKLSEVFDDMIFDINFIYGQTPDNTLSNSSYSDMIYWLKELRNLFSKVDESTK